MKNENINLNSELSDVLSERFERYAKYIIQERALPDIRDGLKPVQRRSLYALYDLGLTSDKPHKKSARIVGEVIGKYHPHGDSSVYEAIVRLSQKWKLNHCLVDMHGNNGSIDGDSAAAMRYTESRLSSIAEYLLKDLDKNTVLFAPNFDDSEKEPIVLPAFFPNLLINGATGIAAGYATNIPPHNLNEVIEGLIYRIQNPDCDLKQIMKYIKGPDFPTGGIIQGTNEIAKAYEKGKGRIVIKSKIELEDNKNHKSWIITEIPYDVLKQDLIRKIDDIRYFKKIPGIIEVRDETDRHGLRIVIEMEKESDHEAISKYLFKNTNLQIYYNFNLVAIKDKCPILCGLLTILDAYISHQKEVITKRAQFDLQKAKNKLEIVDGLIKAVSILDQIIKTIRQSKNKSDAEINLIKKYDFTLIQAQAIVNLRLYRLTSTDLLQLIKEKEELQKLINYLNDILNNHNKLQEVIINELQEVQTKFDGDRKSILEDVIEEIIIDEQWTILEKNVFVSVSRDGYIKLIDQKSIQKQNINEYGRKPLDINIAYINATTLNTLLVFTSNGNYCVIPLHRVKESRWREIGNHINTLSTMSGEERVLGVILLEDFKIDNKYVILATKKGLIKKSILSDFEAVRISKAIKCINLKNDDQVVSMLLSDGTKDIMVTSNTGFVVRYNENDIPTAGIKASGVKAMNIKPGEEIVAVNIVDKKNDNYIFITNKSGVKRMRTTNVPLSNRPTKGVKAFKMAKSNIQDIITAFVLTKNNEINVLTKNNEIKVINVKDFNYSDLENFTSKIPINDIEWVENEHWYDLRAISDNNLKKKLDKLSKIELEQLPQDKIKIQPKIEKKNKIDQDINTTELQISFDDIFDD